MDSRWTARGDANKHMHACLHAHATAACTYVKRDLLQCEKRPIIVSKETYYSVKRECPRHCSMYIYTPEKTHVHVNGSVD